MAIAVVLKPLVLLFCTGVFSQSPEEYAAKTDLDNCGQSCPSSCEEAEDKFAVCRCDSECERYGDCCEPQSGRLNCDGGEQRTQPLAGLQCRSIHLDSRTQPDALEAFWMVSACPEDWLANQDNELLREVDEKCIYGSHTLPPVTDLHSGVVYKNEYCAVCHQVTSIQPWTYRFGCSPCLQEKVTSQSINLTREMIEQECIACGFHVPQTGLPPRLCLHDSLVVDDCLAREVLEERTGITWKEDVYRCLVTQCQSGPVRPVAANYCNLPPYYRNQYCAICNAMKTADLYCANPHTNPNQNVDYCLKEAEFCKSNSQETFEHDMAESNYTTHGGSRMRKAMSTDSESDENSTVPETTTPTSTPEGRVCGVSYTPYASFSLFFDVKGDSGVITSDVISSNVTTSCSKGQVFDPIKQACRQTICPEGFATLRGSCAIVQNTPLAGTYNSSNDSLITCDDGLIVLQESEFERLDNDTLLFRNDIFEIVGYNGSSPIICSNFSQIGSILQNVTVVYYTYPSIFSILTYVGCSLSVFGCVLVLLTYSLFKELRTLPGQILMNLVSTILATSFFLMIGIPIISLTEKNELCEATAILLHWLILSQFSWMSIMSFELLRTFYRASKFYPLESKSMKNKMFLLYLLSGWGIPILITITSLLVNYTTDLIQYGRDGFCWIGHVQSFYVVFVAPVALSTMFNCITFINTFILLFKASRVQAKLKKQQNIPYFRIYLSVFSITGLTWTFGFLAIIVRDDWAWYSFIIFTSTQGLVICAAFIFTQKVGGLYKKLFFSFLNAMVAFKGPSKQPTQVSSLVKNGRNSDSASVTPNNSASAQNDANPNEVATQHTRGRERGDQLSVELNV